MKTTYLSSLLLCTVLYLGGVMVELEWNPLEWCIVTRAIVFSWIAAITLVVGCLDLMYWKDESI